jgi:hypothetical protein
VWSSHPWWNSCGHLGRIRKFRTPSPKNPRPTAKKPRTGPKNPDVGYLRRDSHIAFADIQPTSGERNAGLRSS